MEGIKHRKKANSKSDNLPKGIVDVASEEYVYNEVDESSSPSYISADGYYTILLVIVGFVVRLLWISWPDKVVFDEVHFGKFAAKYITRTMHMDVHPPLGKLLITWAAQLAGFDGSFLFENIGDDYVANKVPYVAMRLAPALFGLALPIVAFHTLRQFGASRITSLFGAAIVLFENSLTTQSRFILLDSFYVFFTALTVLCWAAFSNKRVQLQPFSCTWWFRLLATGAALGCAVSVKWVGLAVVATIGVATILQLWNLLGDLRLTWRTLLKHVIARAFALIVVPLIVYLSLFYIHFAYLTNGGTNSSFLSPQFGQTLRNGKAPASLAQVGYGSTVLLRHVASGTNFLHSHEHTYPTGSKQQQVTLYAFRDANSHFKLLKPLSGDNQVPAEPTTFEALTSGSIVRLEHTATQRKLHSHDVRPPLTDNEQFNEVSCYGYKNFSGDSNDHFKITVINEKTRQDYPPGTALSAVNQTVRLQHLGTHCYLMSSKQELPKWGFKQSEVVCSTRARYELSLWVIESPESDFLSIEKGNETIEYEPLGFLGKVLEFNKQMWSAHSSLSGSHPFESRPLEWPLLNRGIAFFGQKGSTIYFFGNFVSWYSGVVALCVLAASFAGYNLLLQRGSVPEGRFVELEAYLGVSLFLIYGYCMHFFPFIFVSRQLFIHHYLPALYFALLAFAWCLESLVHYHRITSLLLFFSVKPKSDDDGLEHGKFALLNRVLKGLVPLVFTLFTIAVITTFIIYSPFSYGTKLTPSQCESLKLKSTWDFACHDY